jgi:hypothetical protein
MNHNKNIARDELSFVVYDTISSRLHNVVVRTRRIVISCIQVESKMSARIVCHVQ